MTRNARALALMWATACAADPAASDAGSSTGSDATDGGTTVATTSASTGVGTTGEVTSSDEGPSIDDVPVVDCIVHVDLGGDDTDVCGTSTAPCRTFTHAIALAGDGCTIALGPGTYSAASGETPPWLPPPNVHVVGAGAGETILDDLASASTQTFAIVCDADEEQPPVRAAVVLEGGSLASLSVLGPVEIDYRTVLVLGGSVELADITVVGGQEGIFVTGDAEVSIVGADVSGAGHAGVKPAGDATVTIASSRMHDNKDAVEPICRATTTVRESEAYCNGNGLEALDRAHTTLIDNDVHHNVNGIAARGAETMVVARGNAVHDNIFSAVIVFAAFDAGTADDPGGNTFGPSQFVGVALANVPTDTFAIGNTWMPLLDGADAGGGYAAGTVVDAPFCTAHLSEIELPPPDPCEDTVPVTPAADVQNFALRDGSCDEPPSCGGALPACPAVGSLIVG